MKDWNRKQYEKQQARVLGQLPKKETKPQEQSRGTIPVGYYPGKPVSFEEAQEIERYDVYHNGTGDRRRHWVNGNGDTIAFSY